MTDYRIVRLQVQRTPVKIGKAPMRVYEPAGGRGDFAVNADGWSAAPVTLMEEPQRREAGLDLMPFEVRSWRLSK